MREFAGRWSSFSARRRAATIRTARSSSADISTPNRDERVRVCCLTRLRCFNLKLVNAAKLDECRRKRQELLAINHELSTVEATKARTAAAIEIVRFSYYNMF